MKKCKLPSKQQSKQEREEFILDFEKEASIMRSIRHPNILQFLGISYSKEGMQSSIFDGAEICIITEYMKQGNLYNLLHDKSVVISRGKWYCLEI